MPPYSPDPNPIELTYNTLKASIKRHFNYAAQFDDWGHFLDYAVTASECDVAAEEYFTHAEIVYSADEINVD